MSRLVVGSINNQNQKKQELEFLDKAADAWVRLCILSIKEKKLTGHADEVILRKANDEKRILITGDKDFGGIIEHGPLAGKGRIVLLRYKVIKVSLIVRELLSMFKEVEKSFIEDSGLLVVLSEGRYRLHHYHQKRK